MRARVRTNIFLHESVGLIRNWIHMHARCDWRMQQGGRTNSNCAMATRQLPLPAPQISMPPHGAECVAAAVRLIMSGNDRRGLDRVLDCWASSAVSAASLFSQPRLS